MSAHKRLSGFILLLVTLLWLAGCGGGKQSDADADTGAVSFSIVLEPRPMAQSGERPRNFSNCFEINTVVARVRDGNETIAQGRWDCEDHNGTLTGIPAGNLTLFVQGLHEDENGHPTVFYESDEISVSIRASVTTHVDSVPLRFAQDAPTRLADWDGDGYAPDIASAPYDCDDDDPDIYPGAREICNDGIDQDCDGSDMTCPDLILSSPIEGAHLFVDRISLLWSHPDERPENYCIEILAEDQISSGMTNCPISVLGNINNHRIDNLTVGRKYSWQVWALDEHMTVTYTSPKQSFYTIRKPAGLRPGYGACLAKGHFQCQWDADLAGKGRSYRFDIDTFPDFRNPTSVQGQFNTFDTAGLAQGTTYYWRVFPVDANGLWISEYVSNTGVFTTLGVPRLAEPADGAANIDPGGAVLKWEAVSGAARYRIIVSEDSRPSTAAMVVDEISVDGKNSYTVPGGFLSGIRQYFWQVAALDSEGHQGAFSEHIFNFTTGLAVPKQVKAWAGFSKNSITFQPVPGADAYNVYWSPRPNVTTENSSFSGPAPPIVHGGIETGTTYYYRVEAENSDGVSALSEEVSSDSSSNAARGLTAPAPEENALFGGSVDVSGNYAIIGAARQDHVTDQSTILQDAGAVYIYSRNTSGDWDNPFELKEPVPALNALFGCSVAIDNDLAVIGACGTQAVYLYHRTAGANQWRLEETIVSQNPWGTGLGGQLSISGNYVIVGEGFASPLKSSVSGHNYIYCRTGENSWDTGFEVYPDDVPSNIPNGFGASVAISQDYAMVGDDQNGALYVFRRTVDNQWGNASKIVAPTNSAGGFGNIVVLDGDYAVIAGGEELTSFIGKVYTYHLDRTSSVWTGVALPVEVETSLKNFHIGIAIDGDFIAVGDRSRNSDMGAVYLFNRTGINEWNAVLEIHYPQSEPSTYFGDALAIADDTIIIGAPREDGEFSDSGAVYIY